MTKPKLSMVIMYGVCALLWIARTVLDIINREYNYSSFTFVLNIICAVMWTIVFVTWLIRYRSYNDKHDGGDAY